MNEPLNQSALHSSDRLEQFESEWLTGSAPDLAGYFRQSAEVDQQLLEDLVEIDLEYRWKQFHNGCDLSAKDSHGFPLFPKVDDYAALLPHALRPLILTPHCIAEEYRARFRWGDRPDKESLLERFSSERIAVKEALERIDRDFENEGIKAATKLRGIERFELVRKLGEGGMGAVYLVFDRELKANVALKVLPEIDAPSLFRFKREFRSLIELDHPNLVSLYELISQDNSWFFTMEYVEGVDFLTHLKQEREIPDIRHLGESTVLMDEEESEVLPETLNLQASYSRPIKPSPIPLDLPLMSDAFCQLAEGIHAIHQAGKLHRDIKPSNVLVRKDGTVMVLDFGLITELHSPESSSESEHPSGLMSFGGSRGSDRSISGHVVGTAKYVSPEHTLGEELTEASDWYAVGVILFVALTGRYPFEGRSRDIIEQKQSEDAPQPSLFNTSIPPRLEELCNALLSRNPKDRPNYEQIVSTFNEWIDTGSTTRSHDARIQERSFIGRKQQLESLQAAYRQMSRGNLVTVAITGRSGVGKSSLVQAFLDSVSRDGVTATLSGNCFEQESVPYKTLDNLMDALYQYLLSRDVDEVKAQLPRNVGAIAKLFPVLNQIEAIANSDSSKLNGLLPHELRKQAFRAWNELIARISDRHPLILYIDDLQWGDRDSVDAFQELLDNQIGLRVLLIFSFREEQKLLPEYSALLRQMESGLAAGKHTHLYVEPFTKRESRLLVRHYLGKTVRSDQIEKIVVEAQGNPYLIQAMSLQCAEMIRRGERLRDPDLAEVLHQRISKLDEQSREFLEVLSVAGKPTRIRDILNSVTALQEPQRVISRLHRNHFIRGTGIHLEDSIMTYHDRIRESILSKLGPEQKQESHARLAATFAQHQSVDFETLAIHQEGAHDFASAGESYLKAGRQAAEALAFEHSVALYHKAFQIHPGFGDQERELRLEYAEALANAGKGFESATQFVRVAETLEGQGQQQARERAATQYCISGHSDEGRELFRSLLAEYGVRLRRRPMIVLVSLLWQRFQLKLRGLNYAIRMEQDVEPKLLEQIDVMWNAASGLSFQEPVVVASLQTRGLRLALSAGEPNRLIRAISWEAALTATDGPGRQQQTQKLLSIAHSLAELLGTPYAKGMLRLGQGTAAFLQVRLREALEFLTEAEQIFSEGPYKAWWELAGARSLIVWCHMHLGNFEPLRQLTHEYLKDAEVRGDRFVISNLGGAGRPQILLAQNQPGTAEHELQEIIGRFPYERFQQHHVGLLFSQIQIDLYQGRPLIAWGRLDENWNRLRNSMQLFNYFTRTSFIDLRARIGLYAALRENQTSLLNSVRRDLKTLKRGDYDLEIACAHRIEAGLAEIDQQPDVAATHLQTAAEHFERLGFHLLATACRWKQSEIQGPDRGQPLRQQAEREMAKQQIADPARLLMSLMY